MSKERVAYTIVETVEGERELKIPWALEGYTNGIFGLWKRIQEDGGFMDDDVFYPAHRVVRFELRWLGEKKCTGNT